MGGIEGAGTHGRTLSGKRSEGIDSLKQVIERERVAKAKTKMEEE